MFVAAVTVNLRSLGSRSFGFGCVRVQDLEGGGGGAFRFWGSGLPSLGFCGLAGGCSVQIFVLRTRTCQQTRKAEND